MEQIQVLENLISNGKLEEALDTIEKLPQEERSRWQIQNLTGVICAYCGQFQAAETFFCAALEQQPNDANIMYNLADAYVVLNKRRQAENLLQRCAAKDWSGELKNDIATLRKKLEGRDKRHVLMAAYYFPPLAGSGVFRSLRFTKYLPLYGWQPTVISTDRSPNGWNFSDTSIVSEIQEGTEVIRIPDGISTGRETTLNGDRVQSLLKFLRDVLRFSPEADRIFAQLSKSREGIMQLLTFPCGALSWAYDVVQYIEKNVDLDQFRVVYTTSGPSSAHLIGFYLKQKYGIPWVADYRDPWTFNAYGADYDPTNLGQKLLFELESVLLHQANCNITVEESLVRTYEKTFDLPKGRVVSITNGYDEENFTDLNTVDRTDKFTINYSGLIYSGYRSIAPILQAIQQLCVEGKIDLSNIRLRIVGNAVPENLTMAQKYGLSDVLVQTGYISHREALQSNLDSNMLLLLIGDGKNLKSFYSAKVFEYLRSGRPIMAIAPQGGVVDQVLRESGHGRAFSSTQIADLKAMILEEYQKWEQDQDCGIFKSPVIEKFEGKYLTMQLADILSIAVNSSNSLAGTASGDLAYQITTGHNKNHCNQSDLLPLAQEFLYRNYNYIWLKAMLNKASGILCKGATLVTGSSYGVNGIIENSWNHVINCSVSSQDLYYDFLCARKAVSSGQVGRYSKCIIVDGYYASCHDVSQGTRERMLTIPTVYYPIFEDGHHWDGDCQSNLWEGFGEIPDQIKRPCEQLAIDIMLKQGTYFNENKQRGGTVFDLGGKDWWSIPDVARQELGKLRAEEHNKLFTHQGTIGENKEILKEYVHFLHMNSIMPVFVIAPFTSEYSSHIHKEMKQSIVELIASVPEDIRFVDFNQFTCFGPQDFADTDHLSEGGAKKFSQLLVELFGK